MRIHSYSFFFHCFLHNWNLSGWLKMLSNSSRTVVTTSLLSSVALFSNSTSTALNSTSLHSFTAQNSHSGSPTTKSILSIGHIYNSSSNGTNIPNHNVSSTVIINTSVGSAAFSSSSPTAFNASIYPAAHNSVTFNNTSPPMPMKNLSVIPSNITYSNSTVSLNDTNTRLNYTLSYTNDTEHVNETFFHSPLTALRLATKLAVKKKIDKAVFAHYMVSAVMSFPNV